MMNVPTEPTKSTQQVSVQYISTQSAQNYKSNVSQICMIHGHLLTIIYRSGFRMLLTLLWQ